ncbi:hypothetical protein KKP90_02435 [Methanothermococcus sp. SCGC AD-155-E23]|nr:hypothetical protein [Methanothermococcus sp. SCGC AD-155-E23]
MYRLLLLLEGIIFLDIPYKHYILLGIIVSLILAYLKKFWGFMVYLITLLWLSNLLLVEDLFSLDIIYTTLFVILPAVLYLDALLKRDFNLDLKLLGIFSTPLILTILNIGGEIPLILTYTLLLIYAIYLNFKDNIPKVDTVVKIFLGVLIPIILVYILSICFPDILSYPRSQISILLGFTGLYLLLYRFSKIND